MFAASVSPLVLLRNLRNIMAGTLSAQGRLDAITQMIAQNMVAEVCSLYILQEKNELELYATQGLRKEAVHVTRMALGEGLVGTVAAEAQTLNLMDARAHPAFRYKPETGEDFFNSFLGAPVIRGGQLIGVLTVQNKAYRQYSEEDSEVLQTVAMVLAEFLTSETSVNTSAGRTLPIRLGDPVQRSGKTFSSGIAKGIVYLHSARVPITRLIAKNINAELARLEDGLDTMFKGISRLIDASPFQQDDEPAQILGVYQDYARDKGWIRRLTEAVRTGLTAEAAVERVLDDLRNRLMRSQDPVLRERMSDLTDISNRLIRQLLGYSSSIDQHALPDNAILVATSLSPTELLEIPRNKLKAVVLEEGSSSSHISITARAMNLPLIGQVSNITLIAKSDDLMIVNGDEEIVYVRPPADLVHTISERIAAQAQRGARQSRLRNIPTATKDGYSVSLNINIGLSLEVIAIRETGAEGIGLFRTELQHLTAQRLCTRAEQIKLYRTVLEAATDKPVIFRALDLGGDKMVPGIKMKVEENPALGLRGTRFLLRHRGLFKAQMQALLRASAGRTLHVMFPMISTTDEFLEAREVLQTERERLDKRGIEQAREVKVGVMIEVPSMLYAIPKLTKIADFASVGTNDLAQYFFAYDRSMSDLSHSQVYSISFLSALRHLCQEAAKNSLPLTFCGEMLSTPFGALTVMALGANRLSMVPSALGDIKEKIIQSNHSQLVNMVDEYLEGAINRIDFISNLNAYISSLDAEAGQGK